MGLRQFETSLDVLAKEVIQNIENPRDNAILLVTGTDSPNGIITRMYCNNPGRVAGILYGHAINTGEFDNVREMIKHLRLIAATAEALIEKETRKRGRVN